MKFGNSVADIFTIKHMQFSQDAYRFDISIVHCLGLQFFRGHSVSVIQSVLLYCVLRRIMMQVPQAQICYYINLQCSEISVIKICRYAIRSVNDRRSKIFRTFRDRIQRSSAIAMLAQSSHMVPLQKQHGFQLYVFRTYQPERGILTKAHQIRTNRYELVLRVYCQNHGHNWSRVRTVLKTVKCLQTV